MREKVFRRSGGGILDNSLGMVVSSIPFKASYPNSRMFVLVNEPLEVWRHSAYFDIKAITCYGYDIMPAVTIRNLSDETHRALRVRAAHHGRSTEAEIRDIIEAAVRPPGRVKLGSLLTAIGRDAELSDSDVEALQKTRDETPAEPMTFE
jgi:plasmid stability protein